MFFRECVRIAEASGIENIPTYSWFLFQFWPTHRTASKILHPTGRFRIRRVVQAWLFRKSNPDAHYANAVYKFMRERVVKNRQNIAFFSTDTKCKEPIGEPGYRIAAVTRGKKVIIGLNEKFLATYHDFSKLSIIAEAYILHEIPEKHELTDEKVDDDLLDKGSRLGEWYSVQVFYGFKSMVSEGSIAMRCAAEIADVITGHFDKTPPCLSVYSDSGPERKTDNLSVQKSYIALFLKHCFEEVLTARTAANLSYRNPAERVHSIANLGLQSIGWMRKPMSKNLEKLMHNANCNDEIRRLCDANESLRKELVESLDQPKRLLEHVFISLALKGKQFEIFQAASNEKNYVYKELLLQKFDGNLLSLSLRNDFTKMKYPKFHEFYNKHCVSRTYHFHIFKCSDADCPWHEPIRFGKIANFGEPVPPEIADGTVKYILGSDPSEKFLPSKLENLGKRTHGIPFTPTPQTAINVGEIVKCIHYLKPRVVYAKKKLSDAHRRSMKRMLSDFQYVCETVFHDLPINDKNKDSYILEMLHCRENLTCESPYGNSLLLQQII